MYCTRDKTKEGMVVLWDTDSKDSIYKDVAGFWYATGNDSILIKDFDITEFKLLFPTEKLPRKGSCAYISNLKIVRG